jgi:hypothetical protein
MIEAPNSETKKVKKRLVVEKCFGIGADCGIMLEVEVSEWCVLVRSAHHRMMLSLDCWEDAKNLLVLLELNVEGVMMSLYSSQMSSTCSSIPAATFRGLLVVPAAAVPLLIPVTVD